MDAARLSVRVFLVLNEPNWLNFVPKSELSYLGLRSNARPSVRVFLMFRMSRTPSTLRLGLLLYFQGVTDRWQRRLEG